MADDPASLAHFSFFERLVVDRFVGLEKSVTLQLGCTTKYFTQSLIERAGASSRLIVLEPVTGMVEEVRAHLGARGEGRVFFKSDQDWHKLPFDDGVFHSIVSVLLWDMSPDRLRMLREMARVLGPSGMAILTVYLKDSLYEIFDLMGEALNQLDLLHLAQPLAQARAAFLTKGEYEQMALESGFGMCKATPHELKLRFAGSQELFLNPVVQAYWLPVWEAVGGKDAENLFWHVRQALDRYFPDGDIPLTVNGALLVAIK